jgi:hypothetical protein
MAALSLTAAGPSQHDNESKLRADLIGFREVPANSTVANGDFRAEISDDDTTIHYKLTYSGLEGTVTQAHIHFGQRFVAGGISLWLCQVPPGTNDPAGLAPTCPQEATRSNPVEGNLTFNNLVGPAAQGIDGGTPPVRTPQEFAEIIKAIRAGLTYANVHSTKFPSGEIRGQIKVLDRGERPRDGKRHDDDRDNKDGRH